MWANRYSMNNIRKALHITQSAVVNHSLYFREVVTALNTRHIGNDGKIGGPGIIVEVDECKLVKWMFTVCLFILIFLKLP